MKAIVVLALVATAFAAPPTASFGPPAGIPKSITFSPDGSIQINVGNGLKQVDISKKLGPTGEPEVDVTVSGPFIPPQWWKFADAPTPKENSVFNGYADIAVEKRASITKTKTKSQTDVLNSILKDFTGPLDEPTYQKLLSKLNKAVLKGELSPSIYQIFVNLDQPDTAGASSPAQQPEQAPTDPSSVWSQFLSGQGVNFAGQQTLPGQQQPLSAQQGLAGQQGLYGLNQNASGVVPWTVTKSAFVDYLRQQIAQQQLQQLVQQVLSEVQKVQQQQQLAAQQAYGYPQYPPTGAYPHYPVAPSSDAFARYPVDVPVESRPVAYRPGVVSGVPQQRLTAGYPYAYAPNYLY